MKNTQVEMQEHGYRNGHQLLSTTLKLARDDQDAIDRLSDLSGSLRPGEIFSPYLTTYPLPSRSYYVIARTWQDLSASRAGCVTTRSLLIPMDYWESLESLTPLLFKLLSTDRSSGDSLSISAALPPINDPRTIEIVEAMFLENRQPIVVFDSPEAEAITIRAITALWPSLRRNFSTCTYSLAPRKLEGREFDLLFAPKNSRSRFSTWTGRRIDSYSKNPRHRWSTAIANQVFLSDTPTFKEQDELGLLKSELSSNESALRLAYLWRELSENAQTSPTAVLGMLDILNSRSHTNMEVLESITPKVNHALKLAVSAMTCLEAWRFCSTLIGKYRIHSIPNSIIENIHDAAASLIYNSPSDAVEFIKSDYDSDRITPRLLIGTISQGLSEYLFQDELAFKLDKLSLPVSLSLFIASSNFSRNAIIATKKNPKLWLSRLVNFFDIALPEDKNTILKDSAPYFDDEVLAPALAIAIRDLTLQEIIDFCIKVGESTEFSTPQINKVLSDKFKSAGRIETVRTLFINIFPRLVSERFIFDTLALKQDDLNWLFRSSVNNDKKCRLLISLVKSSSAQELDRTFNDPDLCISALDLLSIAIKSNASTIIDILMHGKVPIEKFLSLGNQVLPFADRHLIKDFSYLLIRRGLNEAKVGSEHISKIFNSAAPFIAAPQLIEMAFSARTSAARIGENLILIANSSESMRVRIQEHIDELSNRLVTQDRQNLPEAAFAAWSSLIETSGHVASNAQFSASTVTFSFAIRLTFRPVSRLLVTCFPVIYSQLLNSKGEDDFRLIPALISLPFHFFSDWDRCKIARNNLVDAYLESTWPPFDLILISIHSNILYETLKRINKKHNNLNYISNIDFDKLPLNEQKKRDLKNIALSERSPKNNL